MLDLVSFCKRKGFVFHSSEIYGGIEGVYDYGPLGVELKRHIKNSWWKSIVYERNDVEGLDSAILTHSTVFKRSGHDETFADILVDCMACKRRFRKDHLSDGRCEHCGGMEFTDPKPFNLMFHTNFGPVDGGSCVSLRPESAQGIFTNFKHVIDFAPKTLPFGIAQIGKAFRNEVTTKHFIFRMREFELMELEFFVSPEDADKFYPYWIDERLKWWIAQGVDGEKLRLVEQDSGELAHYSRRTTDIVFDFPFGAGELEGIADRGSYDLKAHSRGVSNTDSYHSLSMRRGDGSEIYPYVIEPSTSVDRACLAIIASSLINVSGRTILKLKPHLAPIKVAVIPLVKNNKAIVGMAGGVHSEVLTLGLGRVHFEPGGNVGRAYRRQDENGTPVCITVDYQSLEDGTVTFRDRDTMDQLRVHRSEIRQVLTSEYYH